MNQEIIIILGSFSVTVLVGYFKSRYHWKYLRETWPELNNYRTFNDYKKFVDFKNPIALGQLDLISRTIISPYFKSKEYEKITNASLRYKKIIIRLIIIMYLSLGVFIAQFAIILMNK